MMRKCFSLLIRLLVKITKLSKATQETTQPISPITSQINGPAENNAYGSDTWVEKNIAFALHYWADI